MQTRIAIVLMIAVALVSISAGPLSAARSKAAQSVVVPQTTTVTMLPGTTQAIKISGGNQTNPHVDCNLTSYTEDDFQGASRINYYDFATNTNHVVPGNSLDLLSDISGSKIAFTEVDWDGDHILVYDTVSESTTVIPSWGRSRPSIGGNLIAFEDRSFSNASEISIYDLTTGMVSRLTNDSLLDQVPAVSPTGNAVVWEKCQNNVTGCDIFSAIQTSAGTFQTQLLTGAGEDRWPRTNGDLVVYVSNKSGENDIYFQRVGGGTEMHLSIPGDQRWPTISGDLISFESGTPGDYDIFVYDLSTGSLYQVTNTHTPGIAETLSDISVCNGIGRIVYAVPGAGDFDVYAFTFQVPSSTANQINDLIALVHSFNLPEGTENSLITKLQDALAAIDASDTATACLSLTAFINASQAQSGKKLTADQANQLINSATQIKTTLGCQ
jgi:hypothetical protein